MVPTHCLYMKFSLIFQQYVLYLFYSIESVLEKSIMTIPLPVPMDSFQWHFVEHHTPPSKTSTLFKHLHSLTFSDSYFFSISFLYPSSIAFLLVLCSLKFWLQSILISFYIWNNLISLIIFTVTWISSDLQIWISILNWIPKFQKHRSLIVICISILLNISVFGHLMSTLNTVCLIMNSPSFIPCMLLLMSISVQLMALLIHSSKKKLRFFFPFSLTIMSSKLFTT